MTPRSTTTVVAFPAPPLAAPMPALPGWHVLVALPAQGLALARREQGGEAAWIRFRSAVDAAGARCCPRCGRPSRMLARTGRCPTPECGQP